MCDLGRILAFKSVFQSPQVAYHVVRLHPFGDGNGRLSRLLMNWVLSRGGFPFAVNVGVGPAG